MKMRTLLLGLLCICSPLWALPSGFVYLKDVVPSIQQDIRYATDNNFVGRPITGYKIPQCILTKQAAGALARVQQQLQQKQLNLKVYDCYRPVKAVKDFVIWSRSRNRAMKQYYYPREPKQLLFKRGYIANYSGHSRGSTVDLTIVSRKKPIAGGAHKSCFSPNRTRDNSLDMGTNFDCLDPYSHFDASGQSQRVKKNRHLLRQMMIKAGFRPYGKEWWHFTLRQEPYPKTYFNFDIE